MKTLSQDGTRVATSTRKINSNRRNGLGSNAGLFPFTLIRNGITGDEGEKQIPFGNDKQ